MPAATEPSTQDRHCVACREMLEFFGPRQGFEYFRCRGCGTIQLHPLPDLDVLADAYRDYENAGHYAASPDLANRINANNYRAIGEALTHHGASGRVLDYGSGWGGLVSHLRAQGLDCVGVDSNSTMATACAKAGLPVQAGGFEAVAGERFAAITLSTVFEHLVDHDRWLDQAREALAPGGLLVSLNPTARFARLAGTLLRAGVRRRELPALVELFCPPWHTVFFSIPGMERLARRHGFMLREVRFTPSSRQPGPLGWAQATLERVNRVGWWLAAERWPLQVCHTFVFQNAANQ